MKKIDKKRPLFYIEYTLIFAAFMAVILYFYRSNGKAIVHNSNDGFKQNYRALLYISNHFKTIINNIFINHTFVIPQWDLVIGEGADILETFHYYGLGDPINLLSVFFNESNLYIFHDLSIFLRMYLSGLFFSWLCFYKKHENSIVVLTGSILYAYCSYSFRVMTNYIYFINPVMYFPLVILGVEKIFDENKGTLLTIAVFLCAITSIYFFYMIVIATVLYVGVKLLVVKDTIKNKLITLLNIFKYSFFGVLIGSIVFLPSAYSMISNSRSSSSVDIDLFYDYANYKDLFCAFIFNGYKGSYYGGYTVIGLFAVITIIKRRDNKFLCWLLLLGLAIMALPIFASIFNAMTFITTRYQFVIALLVTYCVVDAFDDIDYSFIEIIIYLILLIVNIAVSIYFDPEEKMIYLVHFVLGLGLLLSVIFVKNKKLNNLKFLLVAIASLLLSILFKYLPNYWDEANANGASISKLANIHNEIPSVLTEMNDNSFYRYSGSSLGDNICVNHDKSSTSYYWSVANNNIADFRTLLGYHDISNFYITDYDGDYIPNSLAGVKYYFANNGDQIPYGYELLKEYDEYDLYINKYSLPIIYGYDDCISIDDYNNASLINRQEILTKYVVVDDRGINHQALDSDVIDIKYSLRANDGILLTDNTIDTLNGGESLCLDFASNESGEYYFVIEGVTPSIETELSVSCGTINKSILTKNHNSHAYGGRHNFAVNIGYYDSIDDSITVTINGKANLYYEKMSIYCLPVSNFINDLKKLNCIDINDLDIKDNSLSSSIYSDDDKYLCISIPNYDGWKAYLDNQEIELNKYNIMYMGFPIKKGTHDIKLIYETPLLKTGVLVSAVSIMLFIIIESIKKKAEHN